MSADRCTCGMTTLHLRSCDMWEEAVVENALRSATVGGEQR
jgi:hypothetical protein